MAAFDDITITIRAEDWHRVPPAQRALLFDYAHAARWVDGATAIQFELDESRLAEIEAAGKDKMP